jgi:ATP-dependent DNA helicase RecG
MKVNEIDALVRCGESDTLELKKTTGQLSRAAETICGFLNGHGGIVVFGVTPDREIVGQTVSDSTVQDLAQCLKRFEPPAPVQVERIALPDSAHELLVLRTDASHESRPFTIDGRPYERISSTTSVMPQEKYQRLLLERAHSSQRWENLPASRSLEELDQDEISKTVRLGVTAGRMSPSASPDVADGLDRLGLRVEGQVLNLAVVVFGRRMLPHYAQCQLRMARFRGR